jgi:hypothetical protein
MQFRQQSDMHLKTVGSLRLLVAVALIQGPAGYSDATPADVTISPADLGNWQERSFKGRTVYRIEDGGHGSALHASAQDSASGLCQFVQIDLGKLPIARWSWRLDRAPPRSDERGKHGDDQGLRISFLSQSGATPESTLAIQYIWSQNEPTSASWANAYVENAYEVVARSGPAIPGEWRMERRDLAADFRAAFGRSIDRVDAICLMTDGDQTGALVEGWYGDITLQAR